MPSARVILSSAVFVLVVCVVRGEDYLSETESSCKNKRDVLSCGKYTVLRYLDSASTDNVIVTNYTTSPVQLVKLNESEEEGSYFPESRMMPGDGEFTKFIKFVQTRVDRFLRTQGVSIPLPSGFRVVEESSDVAVSEGRGKKKKGLISLLTLLGVFKVKILMGLVLLGIFFIKKVILLSALILPSILHNLKMSCKHVFPHHVGHGEEYHDDSLYGNYGHSGYSKEWERRYKTAHAGLAAQGALGA